MWNNVTFTFSGANVLVTGGTSGLGRGVAQAFHEAGANVSITGTRGSAQDYDDDLGNFNYLQMDVESAESIDSVADKFSELDFLIHSAGIAFIAVGMDENDPDVFARAVNMHLTSVQRLSQRLKPVLANSTQKGGGAIVCMASMSSILGFNAMPGYGSAKTGLLGLIRSLAVSWAGENIRMNAIAAGLTRSRMTSPLLDDPDISGVQLARIPLQRHGEPEDISGAALFLCSDAASWITGQVLPIDGGFSIYGF